MRWKVLQSASAGTMLPAPLDAAASAPLSGAPSPHALPSCPPPTTQYRDDDAATPDRSGKPIPEWARSHKLGEVLAAQQFTDPDQIFTSKQNSCPLDKMFAGVGAWLGCWGGGHQRMASAGQRGGWGVAWRSMRAARLPSMQEWHTRPACSCCPVPAFRRQSAAGEGGQPQPLLVPCSSCPTRTHTCPHHRPHRCAATKGGQSQPPQARLPAPHQQRRLVAGCAHMERAARVQEGHGLPVSIAAAAAGGQAG